MKEKEKEKTTITIYKEDLARVHRIFFNLQQEIGTKISNIKLFSFMLDRWEKRIGGE